MSQDYQICTRCIMDTTDPNIRFDINGLCNHCRQWFDKSKKLNIGQGEDKLKKIVIKVKEDGKNKDYDCIVGVSGGVDSTFTVWKLKEMGLKPLAVHMDNGWNSELSVSNIENILNNLDIDLFTKVLDWDEFKDLQLSFLKASTPDGEIPTDHAIKATIMDVASTYDIKYQFTGYNHQTEGILPSAWSHGHTDWRYIKNVQKQFGTVKLKDYPHMSLWKLFYQKRISPLEKIYPLNYINYEKNKAIDIITSELDWREYGGKHYESIYTRFFQGYILPRKFNIDKRRAHLSTLICSGQISREEALAKMEEDPYPSKRLMEEDKEFVIKKLDLNKTQFDNIMEAKPKSFEDYPSYENSWYIDILMRLTKFMRN